MCRSASALNIFANIIIILSFLACGVSFAAPFWVIYPHAFKPWKVDNPPISIPQEQLQTIGVAYKGLLAWCFPDNNCTWFWENDFELEKSLPNWYKFSQIAFVSALISASVVLLLQSVYICCRCCDNPCCFPVLVASFTLITALLAGLSLAVFAGFAYKDGWFDLMTSNGYVAELYWAFHVGSGGVYSAFLAAILLFCDGCKISRGYRGYSSPPSRPKM